MNDRFNLTLPQERLLLCSVFFVALPHAFHLRPAVVLFFAALVAWRWAAGSRPEWRPKRPLLTLVTLAGAALVFIEYHRFYGREAGSALFLTGLGLKLMEMRGRRDVYLVVFLGFFVALTQYLFSQSIPMAGYTLLAVALSIAVLIGLNGGPELPPRTAFRISATMLAQAFPVMVVLFVFFPRIAGPLWRLPDDGQSSSTGLSDIIEPGSVSRLGQSFEPAFRVEFEGPPPPQNQMYWRGPVFWRTDGRRWTLPVEQALAPEQAPVFSGPGYRYTLTLEPHRRTWVFALDLPSDYPGDLRQTTEYLLLSRTKIESRRQFRMESHPAFHTPELGRLERRLGLQLPDEPSERVRALVDAWTGSGSDERRVVQQALRHFRIENFVYTLRPPRLDDAHPIETFLFETRRGFCEHYATAFVYLMRVAGIPARIVTGYQGGQWNTLGKFLEVRQADAHAWAEVWLPGQGWSRVDPTAAIAPDRIEHGVDLDRQAEAGEVRFNPEARALMEQVLGYRAWLREARMAWASVDHAWNSWVLSYNPEKQRRFWDALGIVDWRRLALWLGGLLAACALLAALIFRPRRTMAPDPALLLYRKFLGKLARRGVVPRTGEGPLDFAARAASARPESEQAIAGITGLFVRMRYGRSRERDDLERLRRLVGEFRE